MWGKIRTDIAFKTENGYTMYERLGHFINIKQQ